MRFSFSYLLVHVALCSNIVHDFFDLRRIKQVLGCKKTCSSKTHRQENIFSALAYDGFKVRSAVRVSQGDLVLELGHLLDKLYKTAMLDKKKGQSVSQSVIHMPLSRA